MDVGVLGAQNSHTEHFFQVLNAEKACGGARVAWLFGPDDPDRAAELAARFGARLCESEDELIARSDAVAVTYRAGSRHGGPAMKVLRAGKPLFNDKPFAADPAVCREITGYARAHGLPVTGGSSLKLLPELAELKTAVTAGSAVMISFAADADSEYDGYWFYGIHAAELCVELCGPDFTGVHAVRNGGSVSAVISYPDRLCLICTAPDAYDLKLSVTNGGRTLSCRPDLSYRSAGPAEFVEMVRTGRLPRELTFYEKAVELTDRVIRSFRGEGGTL